MPKGFSLLNVDFRRLQRHLPNSILCYPDQKGRALREIDFGEKAPSLVVGADREKALEAAEALNAVPIRLSRGPLPASHEIVLFNILLDRMGMNNGDS